MQPCNLFISIPFVIGDANWDAEPVYANTAPAAKRSYLAAVLAEMRGFAEEASSLEISSVTFGTGSMSTIPESDLREFLSEIKRIFAIAPNTPVHAVFDPGLLSVGQVNELKSFGDPCLEFRYLTSDFGEANILSIPSGETEMKKTSILLEQTGLDAIVMHVALGILGQTTATLEKTFRDALRSAVSGFELVPMREDWSGAQSDTDAALLFEHACVWLESHGFRSTTPTRFMREGTDSPFYANLYASVDGKEAPATLSFGPSTLSSFDGMLWANAGDINRYIRESADPEAITEYAIQLDATALAQRSMLDGLYRGKAVVLDQSRCGALVNEGYLVLRDAPAGQPIVDEKSMCLQAVSLTEKGKLRFQRVFERIVA